MWLSCDSCDHTYTRTDSTRHNVDRHWLHGPGEYRKYLSVLNWLLLRLLHHFQYKDFTFDSCTFPADKMRNFVDKLHQNGQRYGTHNEICCQSCRLFVCLFVCLFVVVIVDPGISIDDDCQSYNDGKKWDVFIKVTAFIGKCVLLIETSNKLLVSLECV